MNDSSENDRYLLTTFTVVSFEQCTIDSIYDMIKNVDICKDGGLLVVASHVPDTNTKNTHYHCLMETEGSFNIPKDFENKSKEEKASSRHWAKIFSLDGITRRSYERSDNIDRYIHYITVKSIDWKSNKPSVIQPISQKLWCKPEICTTCKGEKKTRKPDTGFEQILSEVRKNFVCVNCTERLCKKCYGSELPPCIVDHFIDYYTSRNKCVPISRVAEMLLSADIILCPLEKVGECKTILKNGIKAKQQLMLKIW